MPRYSPAHKGLGPHISIVNQENALQICLVANLMKVVSQLRISFPKFLYLVSCQHKISNKVGHTAGV